MVSVLFCHPVKVAGDPGVICWFVCRQNKPRVGSSERSMTGSTRLCDGLLALALWVFKCSPPRLFKCSDVSGQRTPC